MLSIWTSLKLGYLVPNPIAQLVASKTRGQVDGSNFWQGQYSIRGLMTVIKTGFIPLSPLSVVSKIGMWESSQWFGKNIGQSTG